ncbi:pyruvate dehydrogenase E2 component (dihydrolipoamide acetyltransferase) [Actinomadura madurae]|uniref:Dihydrolipoamide acetyltransferase component of pyruvate dehydrogenase complex n=1 Tax=Actinomadura madurae TaxID=1993 RepID=A0A1I5M518_9ACTN|nr:dihydrolipoamide acetyltransferase family protein [Actinomadura madurae]SFP04036.1 pyruvate dehydrogenase E2 component (dihydrolipoamide acetyltransferase) [Actinomadura madurae]
MGLAVEIRMPRLSESMTEGTIERWLHENGAEVDAGEELAEIDTDKAVVGVEAEASGVLEIVLPEGESAPVGAVIARLGTSSTAAAESPDAAPGDDRSTAAATADSSAAPPDPVRPPSPARDRDRPIASPLARRRARELGVDLSAVTGTGLGGRIIRADVEAAGQAARDAGAAGRAATDGQAAGRAAADGQAAGRAAADGQAAGRAAADGEAASGRAQGRSSATRPGGKVQAVSAGGDSTRAPLTRIQQATVRRLADGASVPVFALTAEVDMNAAMALRSALAEVSDPAPTVTDLVVGAVARALREFPRLNASADDGAVLLHPRVNVGIATETRDGLILPVVKDADRLPAPALAAVTKPLIARVRDGAATPADLDGATFTVSNLGMFGIVSFEAAIVPPQAAILAVGAVRTLPRWRDALPGTSEKDGVVAVPVMELTLTCDHRVVDGADAARFLTRVVALLHRPLALTVPEATA